jgi:hypothetical protein
VNLLGPIPAGGMPDAGAWCIHEYSFCGSLSSCNEAIVLLRVQERGLPSVWRIVLMLNPHTGEIVSGCAQNGAQHLTIDPKMLAGNIIDLAQTLVERNREWLLTPPSRR